MNLFDVHCSGEVIKHGDVKCVYGEGMPTYKNPFEKGNLIVQFVVHFPPSNFIAPGKVSSKGEVIVTGTICKLRRVPHITWLFVAETPQSTNISVRHLFPV